jgi:hypothetical protein
VSGNDALPDGFAVPDFWEPWQTTIETFDDFNERVETLFTKWIQNRRTFAWRGVANAAWALHSSLYRRALWTEGGSVPTEALMRQAERRIVADLHRWGAA